MLKSIISQQMLITAKHNEYLSFYKYYRIMVNTAFVFVENNFKHGKQTIFSFYTHFLDVGCCKSEMFLSK